MEDNKPPFAGPYRKASEPRKDQYGNIIKKKNLAKHLAKKAMQMQQQKQMKKEEVEQIDELSREMLGRYSRKAKDGSKDRSKGRELAGRKRWGGTGGISAAKVQATEEVEQTNEARSPRAPSNYAAMMIKKRRKAGTSEFGRHPDKKLSPAQSKHMDTDKDGDIDSTDLKNLRNKK